MTSHQHRAEEQEVNKECRKQKQKQTNRIEATVYGICTQHDYI